MLREKHRILTNFASEFFNTTDNEPIYHTNSASQRHGMCLCKEKA